MTGRQADREADRQTETKTMTETETQREGGFYVVYYHIFFFQGLRVQAMVFFVCFSILLCKLTYANENRRMTVQKLKFTAKYWSS